MPTEGERRLLCAIVSDVLVDIRRLAREGRAAQVEELADAFHNLPREMHGAGRWSAALTRELLVEYDNKYGAHYAAALDRVFASS